MHWGCNKEPEYTLELGQLKMAATLGAGREREDQLIHQRWMSLLPLRRSELVSRDDTVWVKLEESTLYSLVPDPNHAYPTITPANVSYLVYLALGSRLLNHSPLGLECVALSAS